MAGGSSLVLVKENKKGYQRFYVPDWISQGILRVALQQPRGPPLVLAGQLHPACVNNDIPRFMEAFVAPLW